MLRVMARMDARSVRTNESTSAYTPDSFLASKFSAEITLLRYGETTSRR